MDQFLPREARLKLHADRIAKEEAAANFASSLSTDASVEDLQAKLAKVRDSISALEVVAETETSPDLLRLSNELNAACAEVRTVNRSKTEIVNKITQVKNKYDSEITALEEKLVKLKAKRRDEIREHEIALNNVVPCVQKALSSMREVALRMRTLCKALNVNEKRFLTQVFSLDGTFPKLESVFDSKTVQKLPERLFDPAQYRTWIEWKHFFKANGVTVLRDRSEVNYSDRINGTAAKEALAKCDKSILNSVLDD